MNYSENFKKLSLSFSKIKSPLLIVGLGNPGYPSNQFHISRHNVGFAFLNYLQSTRNLKTFDRRISLYSDVTESPIAILAKPFTFMNTSGKSVMLLQHYYQHHHLLVVHDELDKPIGHFSFKQVGSAGGHKGLKSIAEALETNYFSRLSIGIDRPKDKESVPDYVIGTMSLADASTLRTNVFSIISSIIWNSQRHSQEPSATDIELCKIPTPTKPKKISPKNSSYINYVSKLNKHLKR